MSLFNKLRAWFASDQSGASRGSRRYILEAASLLGGRKGQKPSPSTQVQLLQKMARFTDKEKVKFDVVLEGKPLREVKQGGNYKGLTVHFAERSTSAADVVVKILKNHLRRSNVTVILSDRKLEERVLALGGNPMRTSTFRKALDGSGGGGGESGGRRSSGDQPQRKRQRRRRKPSEGGAGGDSSTPRKDAPKRSEADSAVHELLDVVE